MSGKYKKRTSSRFIYNPEQTVDFKLSRSKVESFIECSRCFYMDRRLGVGRPEGYRFALNCAVDELLKKEFDIYREQQAPHPLLAEKGLQDLIPYQHVDMPKWQDSLHHGIKHKIPNTNLVFHGGIDDVWINVKTQELHIVDYKATSTKSVISLDDDYKIGYKRQAEMYQWLFRQNGFKVSNTFYFVYCNGDATIKRFDATLRFDISLIPYEGDDSWVEDTVLRAYECLRSEVIPVASEHCGYCNYIKDTVEMTATTVNYQDKTVFKYNPITYLVNLFA